MWNIKPSKAKSVRTGHVQHLDHWIRWRFSFSVSGLHLKVFYFCQVSASEKNSTRHEQLVESVALVKIPTSQQWTLLTLLLLLILWYAMKADESPSIPSPSSLVRMTGFSHRSVLCISPISHLTLGLSFSQWDYHIGSMPFPQNGHHLGRPHGKTSKIQKLIISSAASMLVVGRF